MALRTLMVVTMASSLCMRAGAADAQFVQPLGGIPYVDWTIVNYVDKDGSSGVQDYRGGPYSYDGHKGTDFTLPSFVWMDSGIAVYAAASGTVTSTHDGEYDRRTSGSWPANYVIIEHDDEWITRYWHLRKNSVLVTNGQHVAAGEKIAEVGSSGNSTDAHLHFEAIRSGSFIDPTENNMWITPIPYAGDMPGPLDAGINDYFATIPEFKERTTNQVIISTDNPKFVHWIQLHGVDPTNSMGWEIYRPNDTLYTSWSFSPGSHVTYGWYHAGWDRPTGPVGEWRSVFKVDSVIWSEIPFYIGDGADTDSDGIDDSLEASPLQVGQNDQFVDSDKDGASNYEEFIARTDPADPGSVLTVTNMTLLEKKATFQFTAAGGRLYMIESCTNLAAPAWTNDHPSAGIQLVSNVTVRIDASDAETRFYRIKTLAAP